MKKSVKNIKKGDRVKVIFSVGPAHPIYKTEVEAIIECVNGGYDGRQVYAHTVEPVYHPADPKGLLCYSKNGKFLGYEERPAYSKVWEGYVECVIK